MNITKDTLKRLVAGRSGPEAVDVVYAVLEEADRIRDQVNDVVSRQFKLRNEYHMQEKQLEKELEEVRKKCPHYQKSYEGDPAGGRDSHYECDVCGAIL